MLLLSRLWKALVLYAKGQTQAVKENEGMCRNRGKAGKKQQWNTKTCNNKQSPRFLLRGYKERPNTYLWLLAKEPKVPTHPGAGCCWQSWPETVDQTAGNQNIDDKDSANSTTDLSEKSMSCNSHPKWSLQSPALKAVRESETFDHGLPVFLAWHPVNKCQPFLHRWCQ